MYIYDNFVCGDLIKSLQRILATFINSREVCESLIWESMGLIEKYGCYRIIFQRFSSYFAYILSLIHI